MLKVFEAKKFGTYEYETYKYGIRGLKTNTGRIGDFKSYKEFSEFIMKRSLFWNFVTHTPARVKQICRLKNPEYITLSESIALEKSLGLIEMHRGNEAPLRQIVTTLEVDVEVFRKNWCTEYAQEKRYTIFEIALHREDAQTHFNPPQQEFSLITFPFHQSERPYINS